MNETVNIRELNDLIASKASFLSMIRNGMDRRIVGQKHLVDSLLIALLCNGHVLLEGVPGLAKTLAIQPNPVYPRSSAGGCDWNAYLQHQA